MYADDYSGSTPDFSCMHDFLHWEFFPRCAMGSAALSPKKTTLFSSSLSALGWEVSQGQVGLITAGQEPSPTAIDIIGQMSTTAQSSDKIDHEDV